MDIEQVDHVLNRKQKTPCLVGSPSEEILVGFVGTMMVTPEALRVPSSCPVGNGTCDVGSGSQNICGGSIPSRSTSDIWELQGL